MGGHCFFSDLGQEIKDGDWTVVFKGVFIKCRFFQERRDNGLFKPVREDPFTEGEIYDIGGWSE